MAKKLIPGAPRIPEQYGGNLAMRFFNWKNV
jgi:hypothetical protein